MKSHSLYILHPDRLNMVEREWEGWKVVGVWRVVTEGLAI